jgi:hypothetical protein
LSFDELDAALEFVERGQSTLQNFDVRLLNAARFFVRRVFGGTKSLRELVVNRLPVDGFLMLLAAAVNVQ